MIRAVLFDFDQTLVDFHPSDRAKLFRAGAERVYAYLSAHELPMPAFEPFCRRQRWLRWRVSWTTWLTGGEPNPRRLLRKMCRDFGLQRDESCLARLGWLWYEPITEAASVAADVIPTLNVLRDNEIQLGLIVNTPELGSVIDQHLKDLGLLEFFPARAYSTEIGVRKPHPHLYQAALEQLGVTPAETLFVGDQPKPDLLGAHQLGMTTVLRGGAGNDRASQAPYADYVIRNVAELIDILALPMGASSTAVPIPPMQIQTPVVAMR